MSSFPINDDDVVQVLPTDGLTDWKIPLNEVIRQRRFCFRFPSSKLFWISLSATVAIRLIVTLAVTLGTHRLWVFRQKFQKLHRAIAMLIEQLHHSLPSARQVTRQLRQQFANRVRPRLPRLPRL